MTQHKESSPPSVLIVEDEPILRLMAIDLVEDAGFVAAIARNPGEAIHSLETRPDIRIVFTDIDMPGGVDGVKMAAAIRDRWPPMELIITSSKLRSELRDLPIRAVFFPKPYRRDLVAKSMRDFMRGAPPA